MLDVSNSARRPCTLVVPCYNESSRLDTAAFLDYTTSSSTVKFLFVNDGSTDDTLNVLQRLCRESPEHFSLLDLEPNQGKAEAVRQGILAALDTDAEFVGFWDADLATPLDAIREFTAPFDKSPALRMVLGSRVRLLGRKIERRTVRHYLGRIFATAVSLTLGLPVYDTQCGAKLFRSCPEVRRMFETPFRTRWIFDVEILARWIQSGRTRGVDDEIHELPLREWRDVPGSKLKMRDFARAAWGLAEIYWIYLRSRRRVATFAPLTVGEAANSAVAKDNPRPAVTRPM